VSEDGTPAGSGEQLELLRSTVRGKRPKPPAPLAEVDPVAQVVLQVPLAHLDHPFDFSVPQPVAERAVPGARCVVRFSGQQVEGFVVARTATSEHPGRLQPLLRVPSGEPVLTPQVLAAARAVADETAGTLADVLRLAVPPRHAATEAKAAPEPPPAPDRPAPGPWTTYTGGPAFLDRVAAGGDPRAVWTALPDAGSSEHGWPGAVAVAALTAASAGRGALVVVPDHRDVERVWAALGEIGGAAAAAATARLTADLGPSARYAAFLRVLRGGARVVVGTRAAAFAPVHDLGLVVCWDDGDDLHAEPRAPYPHARDVLRVRAEQAGAAALLGSSARSVEAQLLVETGWARAVEAPRAAVREHGPRVVVSGDDDLRDPAARTARIPSLALRTAREALATGPVLVQVPRSGYVPSTACQDCRTPARCATCHGPLQLTGSTSAARCGWCARTAGGWRCPECGSARLRSVTVGVRRTAEEIGRALPGVPVRTSSTGSGVLAAVGDEPAVVLATPGAEPVAQGGYAAAVLLDTWVLLARADLRASEEALRRWLVAASLVRPAADGGRVVVVGDAGLAPVQALVRLDPAGYAARELAERVALGLPPAGLLAQVTGAPDGVAAFATALRLPPEAELLGPVPVEGAGTDGSAREAGAASGPDEPAQRLLVRAAPAAGEEVVRALAAARGVLSAAKAPHPPRVVVRPAEVG
jgi:primosomal protein N' (replication factor Y)